VGSPWFAATASAVLAGLIIQIGVTSGDTSVFGGTPLGRSLNVFSSFTIQSNLPIDRHLQVAERLHVGERIRVPGDEPDQAEDPERRR
jgi:hypothetical protein